jgi:hypothetical protein
MGQAKHTPGPWHLQSQESYDGRATYHYLRVFDDNLNAICSEEYGARNDGGRANMHLIAAAPDLLEALEDVIGSLNNRLINMDAAQEKAQAAIAKAKGGDT